jgi:voltage-gated potassium channel Kch
MQFPIGLFKQPKNYFNMHRKINLHNHRKIHFYSREIFKRVLVLSLIVLLSSIVHRFFASINEDIFGAVLFITLFSMGATLYYFSLFRKKNLKSAEYLLSVLFILALTIVMFAIIYAEPIEDSKDYFIELGNPTNLSFPDALYFSITTITTLGYGDIVPFGVFRYFACVEVLMGVMYIATVVFFITREVENT